MEHRKLKTHLKPIFCTFRLLLKHNKTFPFSCMTTLGLLSDSDGKVWALVFEGNFLTVSAGKFWAFTNHVTQGYAHSIPGL